MSGHSVEVVVMSGVVLYVPAAISSKASDRDDSNTRAAVGLVRLLLLSSRINAIPFWEAIGAPSLNMSQSSSWSIPLGTLYKINTGPGPNSVTLFGSNGTKSAPRLFKKLEKVSWNQLLEEYNAVFDDNKEAVVDGNDDDENDKDGEEQ